MNWEYFWNKQASVKSALQQVGRNGADEENMHRTMQKQAAYMATQLNLQPQHVLLDVCCGNGVFTAYLQPHCARIIALDLSSELIALAKQQQLPNTTFEVADALNLQQWPAYHHSQAGFDHATLCFSFQYFETVEQGMRVIDEILPLIKPGGKLLLTDIPDRARFFKHYHNFSRIIGLVVQMAKGKNVMGKFWSEEELAFICKKLGVSGTLLKQPTHFTYAHYRMDYLITKP